MVPAGPAAVGRSGRSPSGTAADPDVSIVPPVFALLVADSRIGFSLATTDPAGEPTTGTTRTRTHVTSSSSDDDDVERTSPDGSSTEWVIGRGDAPQAVPGRWRTAAADRFEVTTARIMHRVLEVVHRDPERLEVRSGSTS